MFETLFGSEMPLAARFFIAFLVVLALIGLTAWLVRRFGANRLGGAARGRQPRLAVIDAATVDGRRRLVLIRRDNVEHLLMIGGPTDVVVEPNIVRAVGAREARASRRAMPSRHGRRRRDPPRAGRREFLAAAAGRASRRRSPAPRPYRASPTEEPWLAPEPGARARPADSLTGLAAELSARLDSARSPAPPPPRAASRRARHAPPPPVPPAEPPRPPPQTDHNLAEMAQQLEAALRRAPTPESRPPVTDPLAVAAAKARARARCQAARRAQIRAARSSAKFDAKFEPKFERRSREPKIEPKLEPSSSQVRTQDRDQNRTASPSRRPRAGKTALRQSRRGDGQLARPSVREDVTGLSDRRVRLLTVVVGVAGLIALAHDACRRAGHQRQFRDKAAA